MKHSIITGIYRPCWVLHMWKQADKNTMVLQPSNEQCWTLSDNKLTVVWDMPENVQAIHDRVNVLLKGCKCVTHCTTMGCGYKKKNIHCSEGCHCVNCVNMPGAARAKDLDLNEKALEEKALADITKRHKRRRAFSVFFFLLK